MYILKRFAGIFVVVLYMAFVFLSQSMAEAEEKKSELPEISAKAFVLMDARTRRVLLSSNENEMLPIASTTKIMTTLLAIENSTLSEVVTASANASGVPGTSIYLGIGEQLTMEQMLEALMLRSANDAAVAVAEHIDGNVDAFAKRMNARAEEIGADAHFVNPNGLDAPEHRVSALGLGKIACEALENETFRRLVSMKGAMLPWEKSEYDRVLSNKNKLLSTYEGATGIKTGFTSKAGRCLVFSAERNGLELVGVVLNCGTWFDSAKTLLDWGFETYAPRVLLEAGAVVVDLPMISGERQSVCIVAEKSLVAPCAMGEEVQMFVDVPDQIQAPIERGAPVGRAWIAIDGVTIDEVHLIAKETVGEWGCIPAIKKVARMWVIHT